MASPPGSGSPRGVVPAEAALPDEVGARPRDGPLSDRPLGLLDADPHDGEPEAPGHLVADELKDPADRLVTEDLPFGLVKDPEDGLGSLARGHVARPENEALSPSVRTAEDVRDRLDPDVTAVPQAVAVFRRPGFPGLHGACEPRPQGFAVLRVDEVERVRPEELAGRPARDELVRRADELEPARDVQLADDVDHVVGQPLHLRLGRGERLRDPRPFRHVPDDRQNGVRPVGNDAGLEDARSGEHVERVLERLRRPLVKAGLDSLHPQRRDGRRQELRDRAPEERLARQDQVVRSRRVDLEVPPLPAQHEDEVGQRRHDRAEPQLVRPQHLLGALALDGLGDLRRDEHEEVAVLLGVADLPGVALDRQDADDAVAPVQRDAEPVHGAAPDLLDLAGRDELLEDRRRSEEGPARPEDVLRQALSERLRRERLVDLVDEIREGQDAAAPGVVQGDVEVPRRHELVDDAVQGPEELVLARDLLRRFRDPVRRLLQPLGPPLLRDVPEAPHPPDADPLQALGPREALEDPAVAKRDDVRALGLGGGVELAHLAEEGVRVLELLDDERERPSVVAGLEDLPRNPPHLGEWLVVGDDAPAQVHDEDAVRRGLERRLEKGHRPADVDDAALELLQVLDVRDGERDRLRDGLIGLEVDRARLARIGEQEIQDAEGLLAEDERNRDRGGDPPRGESLAKRPERALVVGEIPRRDDSPLPQGEPAQRALERENLPERHLLRREPVVGDDAEALPVVGEEVHGDAGRATVLDEHANGLGDDRGDVEPPLEVRRELVEQAQGLVPDLELPPRPLGGLLRPLPLGDPVLEAAHDEAREDAPDDEEEGHDDDFGDVRAVARAPDARAERLQDPDARREGHGREDQRKDVPPFEQHRAEEDPRREERDRDVVDAAPGRHREGREDQVPRRAENPRSPGSESREPEKEQRVDARAGESDECAVVAPVQEPDQRDGPRQARERPEEPAHDRRERPFVAFGARRVEAVAHARPAGLPSLPRRHVPRTPGRRRGLIDLS